jgi:hypothetical protein
MVLTPTHNHDNALSSNCTKQVEDIPAALQQYSTARLPDAHAVCKMSENGFGKNKLQQKLFRCVCNIYHYLRMCLRVWLSKRAMLVPKCSACWLVVRGYVAYGCTAAISLELLNDIFF